MRITHEIIKANLDAVEEARRECREFDQYCREYPRSRHDGLGAVVGTIGLQEILHFFDWVSNNSYFGYHAVYESLDFQHVRDEVTMRCVDERVRTHISGMTQRRFNNFLKDQVRISRWGGFFNRTKYGPNFRNTESLLLNWAILNEIEMPDNLPLGRFYTARIDGFSKVRESYQNARSILGRIVESIPAEIPLFKVNHAYLLKSLREALGKLVTDQIQDLSMVYDRTTGKVHSIGNKEFSLNKCSGCGSMVGVRLNVRDTEGIRLQIDSESVVDLRRHRMEQLGLLEA